MASSKNISKWTNKRWVRQDTYVVLTPDNDPYAPELNMSLLNTSIMRKNKRGDN